MFVESVKVDILTQALGFRFARAGSESDHMLRSNTEFIVSGVCVCV